MLRVSEQIGSLVGRGALAAALASVPATVRVVRDAPGQSALVVWIVLAAATTLPAALALVVLRRARYGLRAFEGPEASLLVLGLSAWLVSSFVALAFLAGMLRATTHHRPLAGVTYAFLGLGVMLGLGLTVRRLVGLAGGSGTVPRVFIGVLAFSTVFLALVTALFGPSLAATKPALVANATHGIVLDLLALSLAAWFLGRERLVRRRLLLKYGLPFAAGMFVLGLCLFLRSAPLQAAVREGAPALTFTFAPLGPG